MVMSKQDVQRVHEARFEATPAAIEIAKQAMTQLWAERRRERGLPPDAGRAGSCKFAALLARNLFGGRLAGNLNHVFVVSSEGRRIDLNDDQDDVAEMGPAAHSLLCNVLLYAEYRESLSSCTARVDRWTAWAAAQINEQLLNNERTAARENNDISNEIGNFVRAVQAVRGYTGMGLHACRNALVACDNDPLVACGYLHFAGSLVNLNGKDREAWTLRQARDYAKLLTLDGDGNIAHAISPNANRTGPAGLR
ncbi:MAG: hypothetical protein ITG07_02050 [Candidimonas sp.]|nr:hypothetical protein [Candidimonas sp.]